MPKLLVRYLDAMLVMHMLALAGPTCATERSTEPGHPSTGIVDVNLARAIRRALGEEAPTPEALGAITELRSGVRVGSAYP